MNQIHSAIAACALGVAVAGGTCVEWRSLEEPARARFWFDGPALHLALSSDARLAPLTSADLQTIERIARLELRAAFEGWRLAFSDQPRAAYQVRVVAHLPPRPGPRPLAAAESLALGPLGSQGWVSLMTVASLAIKHAPPDTDADAMVERIGRGLGRVAAHEFAHQILSGVNLHASRDPDTYEYASADRDALYRGALRWGLAGPLLAEKLRPSADRR